MDSQSVGQHYREELGSNYFAWQREVGEIGGYLNRWKFQPHIKDGAVVVDFGCGGGSLLAAIDAHRRIGVEPNVDARSLAAVKGIEVYGIASELPAGVADVVISNHALEHTLHPLSELQALRRCLNDQGALIIWLPLDNWRRKRSVGHVDIESDINHHLYTWTPLTLANLLIEAGFTPHSVRVVSHAWPKGTARIYRWMPRPMFDLLAFVTSVVTGRRQVMAIASPKP